MIIFKAKYNPYNIKHLISVLAVRLNRDTSSGSGKNAKYAGDAKLFHTTVYARMYCMYVCIYVYIYVYMHVYMHVSMYIHNYVRRLCMHRPMCLAMPRH